MEEFAREVVWFRDLYIVNIIPLAVPKVPSGLTFLKFILICCSGEFHCFVSQLINTFLYFTVCGPPSMGFRPVAQACCLSPARVSACPPTGGGSSPSPPPPRPQVPTEGVSPRPLEEVTQDLCHLEPHSFFMSSLTSLSVGWGWIRCRVQPEGSQGFLSMLAGL